MSCILPALSLRHEMPTFLLSPLVLLSLELWPALEPCPALEPDLPLVAGQSYRGWTTFRDWPNPKIGVCIPQLSPRE